MTSTRGTAIDRNIEQAIDEVAGIIYWADVFQHEEEGVRGSARRQTRGEAYRWPPQNKKERQISQGEKLSTRDKNNCGEKKTETDDSDGRDCPGN